MTYGHDRRVMVMAASDQVYRWTVEKTGWGFGEPQDVGLGKQVTMRVNLYGFGMAHGQAWGHGALAAVADQ